MKKHLHYALLLGVTAIIAAGCGKGSEESGSPDPTLSISPEGTGIEFTKKGESVTYTVTTNQSNWDAVSNKTWCSCSISKEDKTFTLTAVDPGAGTAFDPATITVTAGDATPITFTAEMTNKISLTPSDRLVEFSATAVESYIFTIDTDNVKWNVKSDNTWCVVTRLANGFRLTANLYSNLTTERTAKVTVTDGDRDPVIIDVKQRALELHVVGHKHRSDNSSAVSKGQQWVNGKLHFEYTSPDGYSTSFSSITYHNGKILIGGYERGYSTVWTDGSAEIIATSAEAPSVRIRTDGNKVYYFTRRNTTTADLYEYGYWLNGNYTKLTEGDRYVSIAITEVIDGEIYLGSNQQVGGLYQGVYWKVGAESAKTVLQYPNFNTYIRGLAKHNGKMVALTYQFKTGTHSSYYANNGISVWENGSRVWNADNTYVSDPVMTFDGDDMYIGGSDRFSDNGYNVVYWKNKGSKVSITTAKDLTRHTKTIGFNKNVYTLGFRKKGNDYFGVIWKDGTVLYEFGTAGSDFSGKDFFIL